MLARLAALLCLGACTALAQPVPDGDPPPPDASAPASQTTSQTAPPVEPAQSGPPGSFLKRALWPTGLATVVLTSAYEQVTVETPAWGSGREGLLKRTGVSFAAY